MRELVSSERERPAFQTLAGEQILMWHEGIACYYLAGAFAESLELLKQALKLEATSYNQSERQNVMDNRL